YSTVHAAALLIPVFTGLLLTFFALKKPGFQKTIGISYAVLILSVRFARYGLDMALGTFNIAQLFSVQICHINMFLLALCLVRPNGGLFAFNFIAGIPTALAVVLFPGTVHRPPATARAVFFIASHVLLVMGALHLQLIHRFRIPWRTVLYLHALPFVVIPPLYFVNSVFGANALYLMGGNPGTVLETMYDALGPVWYLAVLIALYWLCLDLMYLVHRLFLKVAERKKKAGGACEKA
ncbi:MAG: YwaF family protein, partial [Clostridiaceae bacterium]|nr:YwaF family protein [Clostridiaceae bacterium]